MDRKMVSPFLLRPLRSLQEFLQARGREPGERVAPVEEAPAEQSDNEPACNEERDTCP